ncbi:MAG: Mur ligase family protein [Candidatus Uhrbacteria bacterium]
MSIRKLVPTPLLRAYHFSLAVIAKWWFRNPSKRLVVVGVTGTHGKSSVVMLLGHVLHETGYRAGWISTATMCDGKRTWLNDLKMTMPGRFQLQRFLRTLVANGCTHAIVETSSEGIAQHRHRGIDYDVAVLLNLAPEHIESHGGFERYRAAKARLFAHTARGSKAKRFAILPADLKYSSEFSGYPFTDIRKFDAADVRAVRLPAPIAAFPENAAAVMAVCAILGIPEDRVVAALETTAPLPGRMERIEAGQPFEVIVDYAHTPHALEAVYRSLAVPSGKTVHVLGGVGGGRDKWKQPEMGRAAAQHAEVVIVTNEDPYDDDPMQIIRAVADGARGRGSAEVEEILDRREAIARSLSLAKEGDRIIVSGKGCEQAICGPHGSKTPWDDRKVIREILKQQQK